MSKMTAIEMRTGQVTLTGESPAGAGSNRGQPSTADCTPGLTIRQVLICADGLCEPMNPGGFACWAWLALDADGRELARDFGCAGHGAGASNNVAEYHAVLGALDYCVANGLSDVLIVTDSKLIVEQVAGRWQCRAENLVPLRDEARARLAICAARLEWIPREHNTRADALSRIAYDIARREVRHDR